MVTYEIFPWPEYELLIQLSKVEHVFRFSAFLVHPSEEVLDQLGHFRNLCFVWIVIRRVFENFLKQERVSGETSGGFREIAVKFKLP